MTIDDYVIKSCFVRDDDGYGGSIIFEQQQFEADGLPKLTALSFSRICEISAILIPSMNLTVVSLYRPPSSAFDEFIAIVNRLLTCLDVTKNIIIGGDFNIVFNANNTRKNNLLDLFLGYGLKPLANFNTRGNNRLDSRQCVHKYTNSFCSCSTHKLRPLGPFGNMV